MTKRYFLLLLLIIGKLTGAFAQADFRTGYLVRPTGDTVRGEVHMRDARLSSQQCRFRTSADAPVTTFLPTEIRAYGFLATEPKLYRAFTPAGFSQPYFLEALVTGPANLYSLRDADHKDHYYVATASFPLTELVQRKILLEQERVLQEQNIYRNTLAQVLVGCPSVQAQLPSLRFTVPALVQVVAAYNQCLVPAPKVAPGSSTASQLPPQRLRLGLLLGMQHMAMHTEYTDQLNQNNRLDFGPQVAPVVGLALNLPLAALSRKLSLEAELFYEAEKYEQTVAQTYFGGSSYSSVNLYTFNAAYLRLPLLIRYTLPKGRVRPFLEAGPTLAYALKLDNTVVSHDAQGNTNPPTGFFRDNSRSFQEGLAGGVGAQFSYWQGRSATLAVRYETDSGWASGRGLNTWTNRFYGLLILNLFN